MNDAPPSGAGPTDTPAQAAPAATAAPATPPADAGWFFAEGVPGTGERPAYFKGDKYKTLADQAKAYTDLESLHGKKLAEFTDKLKGHAGAPEAYELKMPEGWKAPEGVDFQPDPNHPLAKAAVEVGKKHGLTQAAMSDLYAAFVQSELAAIPDLGQALAQFEPDDAKRTTRLNVMTEFLRANLGEAEYQEFAEQALSTVPNPAAVLKMTERLISLTKPPRTVADQPPEAGRQANEERWKKMQFEKDAHGNRRLQTDAAFKAEWDALGAKLYPGERREVVDLPNR